MKAVVIVVVISTPVRSVSEAFVRRWRIPRAFFVLREHRRRGERFWLLFARLQKVTGAARP